jgi:hypothetical protein
VNTGVAFTGQWDVNTNYHGAFHLAGSDSWFWTAGSLLLDSGVAYATAGGSTGQYHMWLDFQNNSDFGNIYITAEGLWAGLRIDGPQYNASPPSQAGHLNFWGLRVEGRNAGAPCDGALIRMSGGIANFAGLHIAHGMASPATFTTHSPADAGIVHLTGGQANFWGTEYDKATGQADQNPYLFYNNGARLSVRDTVVATTGGTWSGPPAVHTASGRTVVDGYLDGNTSTPFVGMAVV